MMWLLVLLAWLLVALIVSLALVKDAGPQTREEQAREDEEQTRALHNDASGWEEHA